MIGPASRETPRARLHHLAAVVSGNTLEFYDFLVYATFAVYIGQAYFPARDPTTSLLLSLATFGIGFVTRPLGGLAIGWLGDRVGRRPAMLLSFLLMGGSMAGLALTPGYDRIGVAAPLLAVVFRLLQGLALGGEVGPCTAFLVEAVAPERRGLAGSMQGASQGLATLAAAIIGVSLSAALAPHDLARWGWRLALLAGVAIVPFGVLVRRTLPETLGAAAAPGERSPDQSSVRRTAALGLGIIAGGTIGTYVLLYLPTYALHTLRLPARVAFGSGVVSGASLLLLSPVGGWLSDRWGRKRVTVSASLVSLATFVPAFALMRDHPSATTLYLATAAIAIPGCLSMAPAQVAITESFPPGVRSTAMGGVYALSVAVFGGTTQFVVAWLLQATHDPISPAWYRVAAGVVALGALIALPESAPGRARTASAQALAAATP